MKKAECRREGVQKEERREGRGEERSEERWRGDQGSALSFNSVYIWNGYI